MLWEVEILPRLHDPEKTRVCREFELLCVGPASGQVGPTSRRSDQTGAVVDLTSHGYLLEGELPEADARRLLDELLLDSLVEDGRVGKLSAFSDTVSLGRNLRALATVLLKPGVMDPAAQSVQQASLDLGIQLVSVRTFRRYYAAEPLAAAARDVLFRKVLANDAIEQVVEGPLQLEHLTFGSRYEFRPVEVPLRQQDEAGLLRLSKEGQLSLNLAEMKAIQAHFRSLGREPTDVELETLAQTWSEHCSHKTLKGQVDLDGRRYNNLLGETIFAATQEIRRKLGKDDWCVSVFEDNAGVVRFNDDYNVCFKVETHNHPSAIEPYGGASTGVGGVIRDPLGTGLGARPICNTDVFCFAPPDTPPEDLPGGVLHPRKVMNGVVAGVRDYGNRMGIPTVNGAVCYDPRYLGNPLVFCGTVGLIPVSMCQKRVEPGDLIVTVGGRTGRDGIHGATFSSIELTSESEKVSGGAVQIGNAITEKKMLDVLLRARDLRLYRAITDCGAGGFSSAVGEMGEHVGAVVELDLAPLKYEGLSYTEIWISEAQERMILAVPPEHWPAFRDLCASEDVEACVLGSFEASGKLKLLYQKQLVADLDMDFLHRGRPKRVSTASSTPADANPVSAGVPSISAGVPSVSTGVPSESTGVPSVSTGVPSVSTGVPCVSTGVPSVSTGVPSVATSVSLVSSSPENAHAVGTTSETLVATRATTITTATTATTVTTATKVATATTVTTATTATAFAATLLKILSSWNVCSKEWIVRQYDHEVQGGSVLKPLVGVRNDGPGDAAVMMPVLGSWSGLALGCGINPHYGDLDAYAMAALAIDEAVRNVVAVGADPDRIALLDNFCWGNTDRPEVLGSLVRAAEACRDVALAFMTPFISGKDSLNNEFHSRQRHITIPPTLLISALGRVSDVRRCVTMDLKEAGNALILLGRTQGELAGSHYHLVTGKRGGAVPCVDLELAPRIFRKLHQAIAKGLIRSCHDLSEGGLAAALAEMAFAGGIGVDVTELVDAQHPQLADEALLFAESPSRFLLEVKPAALEALKEVLGGDVPWRRLGSTCKEPRLRIAGQSGEWILWSNLAELKEAWQKPLR